MSFSVRYRIAPSNPGAHLFEVSVVIPEPDPAGQALSLPTWIPGSYMIREFARNMVWLKASCAGTPVAVEKQDKCTWRCAPCGGRLVITYEVYAWDLSVRAAHLDESHAFFNGSSVFLMVHGRENEAVSVEMLPPQGERYQDWKVATALPLDGAELYGFGSYRAANYDELIDHPVEMGTFTLACFEACGVQHDVAITGRHRADTARLCADLKRVCEEQIRFFAADGKAPMRRYVFLVMALGEGYGGLEHRASTALVCSRDDLPQAQDAERSEKYRTFLGLASHEYFHTWNVKRIKPASFQPYDLSRESYTRQLWAFEGITSYYDDLMLVRSGLISVEQYLTLIGETVTKVQRGSGRLKQSLADSSFDAWIKFYRQDENAANAVANYYVQGSLVALALDLTIRLKSGGRRSLDDVMRLLWQRHGVPGIGVPEGGVEQIAEEVAGTSLKAFFAEAVHSASDLPLRPLLAQFGIELNMRSAESGKDKGGKPAAKKTSRRATWGASVDGNGEARLKAVHDGGAAQAAGLSAGDVIVAVDGLKVSGNNLDARIAAWPVGTPVKVHAFRRDEMLEFAITPTATVRDTCYLVQGEAPDAAIAKRLESWLGPRR